MNAGPLRDFTMPPLVLIAKIAPFSALATILAAGLTEGPRLARLHRSGWEGPRGYEAGEGDSGEAGGWDMVGQVLVFVLAGGVATFVLLLTETQLLEKTSSLTLGVLGTFKVRSSLPPCSMTLRGADLSCCVFRSCCRSCLPFWCFTTL